MKIDIDRLKAEITRLANLKMDELRGGIYNNTNSVAESIRISRQDGWTRGDCIVDILENTGFLPDDGGCVYVDINDENIISE